MNGRTRNGATASLLAMAVCLLLLGGCPKGGAQPMLTGRIVAKRGEQVLPVGDAQVRVWPSEPGKGAQKFEAEAVQNLRGVATTRPNGAFDVATLSSPQTKAEYPLLKNWTYAIEVEVPGYYVARASFLYGGGSQFVEMSIEEKVADVLDTSGVIEENERRLERGSVRTGD